MQSKYQKLEHRVGRVWEGHVVNMSNGVLQLNVGILCNTRRNEPDAFLAINIGDAK